MTTLTIQAQKVLRIISNIFYSICLVLLVTFLLLGMWASANFNEKGGAVLSEYGVAIHKFPLVNKYVLAGNADSVLSKAMGKSSITYTKLYAIDNCTVNDFDSLSALLSCAKAGEANELKFVIDRWGKTSSFGAAKIVELKPLSQDVLYLVIDTILLSLCLGLSLLLFAKGRCFVSGYLISLALLTSVCESRFFFIGSTMVGSNVIESIRLSIAFIAGPLGLYYFPQVFNDKLWRRLQMTAIIICIVLLFFSFHYLNNFHSNGWMYFLYSVTFTLFVIVVHFILKYRLVLNIKERKQVFTMLFCVSLGLVVYLPLMNIPNYGTLFARYVIMLSVGFGVFFALMRYGLWQVDSLISKSATLSLISVVAFSFWAGLDQGMQALLNQTIGLSNKTFTAFLAAAISSLFAIPAYNYISKSCDSFFNKDLHLLKRFLSKDILVIAETQKLSVFVEQLGMKLLTLSGARKIELEFNDYYRLSEAITFSASQDIKTDEYVVKKEMFEYQLDKILSVAFTLEFVDRRINKEIKNQLEEGTDEIARALASCSRWNYLESLDPGKPKLRPV